MSTVQLPLALQCPAFSLPLVLLIPILAQSISPEGQTLWALKSAITSDPTSVLSGWRAADPEPCRWPGVACANFSGFSSPRVVAVSLAGRNLSGRIPEEIGRLAFLRRLNLQGNRLSGEIPGTISNLASLHTLYLHSNNLSGSLPAASLCSLPRLQNLDLSSNALTGALPDALRGCGQLQRLLLARNRLSGEIPAGVFPNLTRLQHLDLSSNAFTGPIPADLGELREISGALNLSNNRLSGEIPAALGNIPLYAAIDLRNNDLSGEVPQVPALAFRGGAMLVGNPGLCGYPLTVACRSPRSASVPPPAAAAKGARKISVWLTVAICAADAAGVAGIGLAVVYVYWKAKGRRRRGEGSCEEESCCGCGGGGKACTKGLLCCGEGGNKEWEEEAEEEEEGEKGREGRLVGVDGGFEVGLEELLRASAYVVGKGPKGIVYKVVVGAGIAVAVRRLEGGRKGGSGYKEFKAEVEAIGRLRHPNVVRLRAYCWAHDDKLLVTDFVPGRSLASALRARQGQPPLSWLLRQHIIKGVANGILYLHECNPRKFVHGEIKPSNILLDADFKPSISDFGLARLLGIVASDGVPPSSSFSSLGLPNNTHPSSSLNDRPNGYRAPEAYFTLCSRPSQKWDVYSFGMVALEMLTGKSPEQMGGGEELVRWVRKGLHEEKPLDEMVDAAALLEGQPRKGVVELLRLALSCTEADPDSRPRMKTVVECLEKLEA